MEVSNLKVLLWQIFDSSEVLLEIAHYEPSVKMEIRQRYFDLRQCSKILLDLLAQSSEEGQSGEIISTEENEVLIKNEETTQEADLDVQLNNGNSEFNDSWNYDEVKVKLEEFGFKLELEDDISEMKQSRKIPKVHSCNLCGFQVTNSKDLRKHTTAVHGPQEKPYKKCKFCMEEFQMKKDQTMNSRYRNHLEKYHSTQDLSEFQDEFSKMDCLQCGVCEKMVYGNNPNMALSNLNRHMKDMHENRLSEKQLIPCPKCSKEVNPKYLKRHIELTHNDAKFTCDQCGKTSKNKQQMRLHMKEHSTDPSESFQCELCKEMIPPSGSLRLHMYLKHGGRKFNPVTCDECGKQLSDKSKLQKHKDSVHLNKKPFKCDICDLCVSRIDNLKQHKVRVHKINM